MRNTRSPRAVAGSSSRTRSLAGRVLLVVICVSVALGLLVPALGASEPQTLEPPAVHVVKPGETLWKIAQTHAPEFDPRSFIYDLKRLNGLEGAIITPGQELTLP